MRNINATETPTSRTNNDSITMKLFFKFLYTYKHPAMRLRCTITFSNCSFPFSVMTSYDFPWQAIRKVLHPAAYKNESGTELWITLPNFPCKRSNVTNFAMTLSKVFKYIFVLRFKPRYLEMIEVFFTLNIRYNTYLFCNWGLVKHIKYVNEFKGPKRFFFYFKETSIKFIRQSRQNVFN